MPRKPAWVTQDVWRDLVAKYGGVPQCEACGPGCAEPRGKLTVDHILARSRGGSDHASNLQFLCKSQNSTKYSHDDAYWRQEFYWDRPFDLRNCRMSQTSECVDRFLQYREWFVRPWSQISRRLYLNAWIVGAGKTLGLVMAPWSLNFIVRMDCGDAAPRCDKSLVLCKELAIRDQLAKAVAEQVTDFAICGIPPKVGVITHGSQLDEDLTLAQADIWFGCIHMLYEKNHQPRKGLEKILSRFPVIQFDEPHFAMNQVMQLVEAAGTSLCLGWTGTPIDADGEVMRRFVRLSQYDYRDAVGWDQSLKFITAEYGGIREIVEMVGIEEADVMLGDALRKVKRTEEVTGYGIQLEPVISVAEAVVRYVQETDRIPLENATPAQHRLVASAVGAECDLKYPVHAMVVVDRKDVGDLVEERLNALFAADRLAYPAEKGYRAALVRTDLQDDEGNLLPGRRLSPDHEWMEAKNNGNRLTEKSVRFLVVVGMGREGVDNPLCGVIGLACRHHSVQSTVQRIGRAARSVDEREEGVVRRVPPARLDTVKIITHDAFQNGPTILEAIRFIDDMGSWLERLPDMEHLLSEADAPSEQRIAQAGLSTRDRLRIAAEMGAALIETGEIPHSEIIDRWSEGKPDREKRVREWVEKVEQQPQEAARLLGQTEALRAEQVVIRELPTATPTEEDLRRHVQINHPKRLRLLNMLGDPELRAYIEEEYQDRARRYQLPPVATRTSLKSIRTRLVQETQEALGDFLVTRADGKSDIFRFVGQAVQRVLGVPFGESASDGGKWDTTEHHIILTNPEVRRRILGFVVRKLTDAGHCPALAAVFGSGVQGLVGARDE